ncbi:type II toxin-antitoxin system RelE/ParE family toxin [Tardiphaga alba]|uniref:Type II toxin-antitoxin system RelE/ParE family toxin n=1 Tax=Tardiphaga alba TaxID=340268 RepID=A0ABX8ADL7_9BRAD|nr:type II toxin-antitoxin system RelE/ParE family toxin [Tardiphaga alba]QUS41377.1 type II toxin-antitoxin system RelE/ParE family toxin [Tardiphaga alba]
MQLRTSRYVRGDLDTIWISIARHNVLAADAWLDKIEARFAQLAEFPYSGPAHPEIVSDVRALVVERWVIIYRVTADCVQIVRIVDGARDLADLDLPNE